MKKERMTNHIVCIGGGTGTFVVLRGLKRLPCRLSAIVTMSDSGGSNKRIRDEFGLLPTSDIRQCFVALSEENGDIGLLRKLFMYRFEKGKGISGMTFGNLFMAALSDILGSQEEAIRQTGKVLRIHGDVIPVSFTNTNLYARYEDGHIATEEHLIDEPSHDGSVRITDLYLKPRAQANPEALLAIREADLIVLGPGDLYTSLIPNLLVDGVADAIQKAKGVKAYVVNLMTKYGQTLNLTAADHIRILEQYIGKSIDYALVNVQPLPKHVLATYAHYREFPVVDDLRNGVYYTVVRAPLASKRQVEKPKSDSLVRSLIRHDSKLLAEALLRIAKSRFV